MERRLITEGEIAEALTGLSGWTAENNELTRRFKFEDFASALAFVNTAGEFAEAADHHPDIKLGWGYAEFAITTHDRGGITEVDVALAKKIDSIEHG